MGWRAGRNGSKVLSAAHDRWRLLWFGERLSCGPQMDPLGGPSESSGRSAALSAFPLLLWEPLRPGGVSGLSLEPRAHLLRGYWEKGPLGVAEHKPTG